MAGGSMPDPKRLVVCCDGTWNTPEMDSPTNVVRLAGNVLPGSGDGVLQLLYYDAGVGTGGWMDRLVGGAFGEGLDINVREAYRFIAAGDEIYLFGFSRGAYTVRSLAGMTGYAGLLGRDQMTLVGQAYELYRNGKSADENAAKAFRARHGTNVPPITLLDAGTPSAPWAFPTSYPASRWTRRSRIGIDGLTSIWASTSRRPFTPSPSTSDARNSGTHPCVADRPAKCSTRSGSRATTAAWVAAPNTRSPCRAPRWNGWSNRSGNSGSALPSTPTSNGFASPITTPTSTVTGN